MTQGRGVLESLKKFSSDFCKCVFKAARNGAAHLQALVVILSSSTDKLATTRPLPFNEGCGPSYISVDGFWVVVAPCFSWGQLRSKRRDPWYGRPAKYATG